MIFLGVIFEEVLRFGSRLEFNELWCGRGCCGFLILLALAEFRTTIILVRSCSD